MKDLLAAAAIALLASAPARAQTGNQDRHFVRQAADSNLAQAQLGQFAEQHGTTPAVKEFGNLLAANGRIANQVLLTLAKQSNIRAKPTLPSRVGDLQKRLRSLQGRSFDLQYLQATIDNDKKNISEYQKEENRGQSAAIKTYAKEALPLLYQHLDAAQRLQNSLDAAAAAPATPRASRPSQAR